MCACACASNGCAQSIIFGGAVVPEVEQIKLLGVLIDRQLTHAPQSQAMASQLLSALKQEKNSPARHLSVSFNRDGAPNVVDDDDMVTRATRAAMEPRERKLAWHVM